MKMEPRCLLTVLLSTGVLCGASYGQSTYVDTFEDGRNVGDWSFGNAFERIMHEQGVDGGQWHYNFNLYTCCPTLATRWGTPSIFTGNYREMRVSRIAVDVAILYAGFGGPDCGNGPDPISSGQTAADQPLDSFNSLTSGSQRRGAEQEEGGAALDRDPGIWLILITDNGTPDNHDDNWGAYIQTKHTGSTPSGEGAYTFDWQHFEQSIDPAWLEATEVPEGWSVIFYGPDAPKDPDWQMLMTNVSQVAYQLNDPAMFHLLRQYHLGVDNARITIDPEDGVGDCNGSGVYDRYELAIGDADDCNRNGIPDTCDLANGLDTDCSGTGVLDHCLAEDGDYVAEGGYINDAIGTSNTAPPNSRLVWANRFDAGDGDVITSISVAFHGSGGLQPGEPIEVYLWDDVNNDGSPEDATVLATAAGTVLSANEFGQLKMVSYDTYAIEPTAVSGTFFVGVAARGDAFPGALDATVPVEGVSWTATADPGADAAAAFQDAVSMQSDCFGGVYMIRANVNDVNNDGVPDVCEAPLGDLTGDGVVDVSDLLVLLGAWGSCGDGASCDADLNLDGTVDVSDLLMLLGNWG